MDSINSFSASELEKVGILPLESTQKKDKELGQEDFMRLLVAQLENQNPLEPQDNAEFITQIAQFGTLDGIGKLNGNFDSLSNAITSSQALQASALVGRSVLVPSETSILSKEGSLQGTLSLSSSVPDLTISINNASGALVYRQVLGSQPAGNIPFSWDGYSETGERLPEGQYTVSATATQDGATVQIPTSLQHNVDSVVIGKNNEGLILNLSGHGQVNMDVVEAIR